ncbi:MAG: hypothetical protein Q7U04_08535 [Bacteriovorax sp.]|nr:hypothetical protein [Bacteriovorax sp.]
MLWTVVISDMMFKLEELAEIYEDTKAHKILNETKKSWQDLPTSSEWEIVILDKIYANYSFASDILKVEIEHLKKLRNICAHPTYGHELNLYQPNGEQCKGLIRTFLDGLFVMPPLNHKAFTESLLKDLAQNILRQN